MTGMTERIWWHVYPLGFAGAPIREPDHTPGPRLRRVTAWLDDAADLGFTGLLLGPLFTSSTHGYDTLDHLTIDPRLGSLDDFLALVEACRERDMAVLLDGVFNHVGAEHRWVRQAEAAGPDADDALVALAWNDGSPTRLVFEGHEGLVRLNHSSRATVREVARIMGTWMDAGIAGWRLDAAYAAAPEFWAAVATEVRATHPEAWLLGEMIHGDYAGFAETAGLNTVTQYELWKAIWSTMVDRNAFELSWALDRHAGFCSAFVPATFVGNHDVTRIASRVGPDGARAAVTLLMTLPGTPFVYYGDERGLEGVKEDRLGGDDAVRPAFPASPATPWDLPEHAASVMDAHRAAISLRRANPWITTGSLEVLETTNESLVYTVRSRSSDQSLTVRLDLAESPRATVELA